MASNGWVSSRDPDGPLQPSFIFSVSKKTSVRKIQKLSTIEDEIKENCWISFAQQSTCAAVIHLGSKTQPFPVKIIWRIAFFVGILLTAVSTYFSTKSFMNLTGSSEMLLKTDLTSNFEHPKYHICISNIFNFTILAELGFVDKDIISYLMLSLSLFSGSLFFLNNVEYQQKMEAKFNDIMIDRSIKDVSEIIQKALLRCDEIIVGCIAHGIHLDGIECCAKFFPKGSFASPTGACVSTSCAPPFYQAVPSIEFGFIVLVKDHPQSRDSLDSSIINPVSVNQKGVYFMVSDNLVNPLVVILGHKQYTRTGLWTSIALSKTIIDDEEMLHSVLVKNTCANRKELDRYRHTVPGFTNYTVANCEFAFRQRILQESIGCHIAIFPYEGNLPPCRPYQLLKYSKLVSEHIHQVNNPWFNVQQVPECVTDCWREMYSISASYADLHLTSNFTFGNWTVSHNQSNQIAVLNFYYPTFVTTLLVNHYPTISEWLGVLGGNLGLFLGASMVTLIEMLVFCFRCCCSPKPY